MKKLLLLLLMAVSASGATLVWDVPTGDPFPATGFKVYRLLVGQTNWSNIAVTLTNGFPLVASNSIAGTRYSVSATNVFGESDRSAEVIVGGPPLPPTNIVIRASIEAAPSVEGPWITQTNLPLAIAMNATNQFFRSRLTLFR